MIPFFFVTDTISAPLSNGQCRNSFLASEASKHDELNWRLRTTTVSMHDESFGSILKGKKKVSHESGVTGCRVKQSEFATFSLSSVVKHELEGHQVPTHSCS